MTQEQAWNRAFKNQMGKLYLNKKIKRGRRKGSSSCSKIPTNMCEGNDGIRNHYSVTTIVVVNSD